MGEITEMILEGILCEVCGVWIESKPEGFPRSCSDCKEE